MKLYVTYISPYARLARILVLEKGMSERVAAGRTPHGPLASRGVFGSGTRTRSRRSNEYAPSARGLAAAYFRDGLAARDSAAVRCLVITSW